MVSLRVVASACLSLLLTSIFVVLVNNLRVNVKPMYRLYCVLKDREEPPTVQEIAYASGQKKLSGETEAEYIKQLESSTSENIKKAFEDQQARAGVSENHPFTSITCV